MNNVTFSADEELIRRARLRAAKEKTTLNAAFREWLSRYASVETGREQYSELMKSLAHVKTRRRFSRQERNER